MCKHTNCIITEYTVMARMIIFRDGEVEYDPGDEPQGDCRYEVECYDCGLIKSYGEKRLPSWMKQRMKTATEHSDNLREQ